MFLLSELDDLLHQVGLESAADTAVLHAHHRLLALDQRGLVDQSLVNVELRHVVHNDGALEFLLGVFGLQDVFQQSCLPGTKEPTEQGDGDEAVARPRLDLTSHCNITITKIQLFTNVH